MSGKVPQLLVSVRDVHEALAAIGGGADIVDVKDPAQGSLGRASVESIALIAQTMNSGSEDQIRSAPLSVALGEVTEWLDRSAAAELLDVPSMIFHSQPQFLKLGLSRLCDALVGSPGWFESWMQVRNLIPGKHAWVAVAYADASRALSPPVSAVFEAAVKSECQVLLIDTFEKDESTLLDWLSTDELQQLRFDTTSHGIRLALAGRVSAGQLWRLVECEPDIIAVRGAVCGNGTRTNAIDENRVREFRRAIHGQCHSPV